MHVFLLSIDGQWRWSPPGRVRVDALSKDCDRAELVDLLLRKVRLASLAGEVFLSLDGRTILPPDEPLVLEPGCCVHLLSPPRTIEVTLPAQAALFHIQAEQMLTAKGVREWSTLLHGVLRRRTPLEKAEAEVPAICEFSPSLLPMALEVLKEAADPEPKTPRSVRIEVVATESATEAIARACPVVEAQAPGRLCLCAGEAVLSHLSGAAAGAGGPLPSALRLHAPAPWRHGPRPPLRRPRERRLDSREGLPWPRQLGNRSWPQPLASAPR